MNSWVSIITIPSIAADCIPPAATPHECFEFRIRLFRKHQHQLDIFIALAAVGTRHATSFQPKNATGI